MTAHSQKQALAKYRSRLAERGLSRFEVMGRDEDKALIRDLAKRLAEDDTQADALRATLAKGVAGEPPGRGGILRALRASPLVGVDLDLARVKDDSRPLDL